MYFIYNMIITVDERERTKWTHEPMSIVPIRNTRLSLSSCCIEDWVFSLWELSLSTIYFHHCNHTSKNTKNTCIFHCFIYQFANQYLQLLVGSTTFSNRKVLQLISCTWESWASSWINQNIGPELWFQARYSGLLGISMKDQLPEKSANFCLNRKFRPDILVPDRNIPAPTLAGYSGVPGGCND